VEPDNHPSGAKLLFTDAEVAGRVLNEFRHRIIARTLGIQSRESSFSSLLITMIAIGAAAQGIQGAGTKVRKVQSSPTLGDALIGGTIVKQSVLGVPGGHVAGHRRLRRADRVRHRGPLGSPGAGGNVPRRQGAAATIPRRNTWTIRGQSRLRRADRAVIRGCEQAPQDAHWWRNPG
jgi:hypothetical protein